MTHDRLPRPTGFSLRITLQGVEPPVWRELEVPAKLRVARLHDAIQIAMGWQDEHLYEFRWGGFILRPEMDDDVYWDEERGRRLDADKLTLARLGLRDDDMVSYVYDFGDHWVHAIWIMQLLYNPVPRPRVIGGEGACPPEDVGGVGGYAGFLEAWSDPDHPEHEEVRTWGTGWFSPGPFDVARANEQMAKRFRTRNQVIPKER